MLTSTTAGKLLRSQSPRQDRLKNNLGDNLCAKEGQKMILEAMFASGEAGK
jgi:hypothetical protein